MSYITSRELAEAIGLNHNTVASWLNGYRFARFRQVNPEPKQPRLIYEYNKDFQTEFINFLEILHNNKALKNFEEFIK